MPLKIIVTAKQVIDPEIPKMAFSIDRQARQVVVPASFPPVVNGFDEHALEAALRIKDAQESRVTVVSIGKSFSIDVMRKLIAMGADELILIQDPLFEETIDSGIIAQVLAAAIKKLGPFDLIICGRQASDWDNAQVPLFLAELLGLPCVTLGKKVEVEEGKVRVERIIPEGYEVVEASLPVLVTVSNELGLPRYPSLKAIMAANRKRPVIWKASDLGIDPSQIKPHLSLIDLFIPTGESKKCEFIEGKDEEEVGRNLAMKLREVKLI
ncbi:MAG: electron transfer flavoprotein subunit beta/FixA family protein [Candidatus Tectomicrobia bacterium]|nr:electron transfer flavoprotein subunit beta/FixA family protein [Candidatus Tectomicrobia bacterium]